MTDLPDPPVPHECDCRGLPYMPLRHVDLMGSDFMALSSGDEFKAAIRLWMAAWNELPAGSLPTDERALASRSGLPLQTFREHREMILYGFVECSDGRLYHPVTCEVALEAWVSRRKQSARANIRWERERNAKSAKDGSAANSTGENKSSPGNEKHMQGKGRETEGSVASSLRSESTALDLIFDEFEKSRDCTDAEAWRMAVGVMAQRGGLSDRRARQVVGKFAKDFSLSTFEIARAALSTWRSGTHSPEPYFRKAAESAANDRGTSAAAKPRHADAGEYWPVEVQRRWLGELRENPLAWRPERGPAPGLTGCRVDARLLAEFGYPDPTDPESFA